MPENLNVYVFFNLLTIVTFCGTIFFISLTLHNQLHGPGLLLAMSVSYLKIDKIKTCAVKMQNLSNLRSNFCKFI